MLVAFHARFHHDIGQLPPYGSPRIIRDRGNNALHLSLNEEASFGIYRTSLHAISFLSFRESLAYKH